MASHSIASAAMPLEIDGRLAELEKLDIARHIRRRAGPIGHRLDHWLARSENWIAQRAMVRHIRRAAALTSYAEARDALDRIRDKAASGFYSILPVRGGGRSAMASLAPLTPPGERLSDTSIAASAGGSAKPILLYVAGGGFILPPTPRQRLLAEEIARACNCTAVLGAHRLAPEHPFPQPARDLLAQYRALIDAGTPPDRILVAGDSAGATLILSMLIEARAAKVPMPAGAMLFSPWTDLAMRGWSYVTKGLSSESPFRMESAAFAARLYLGATLPTDPRASPAYADLHGFPPLAIHCSRYDMHFDDAVGLAERAEAANVPARMNYWDSPRHHLERFRSRDARASLELAAEFARDRLRAAA